MQIVADIEEDGEDILNNLNKNKDIIKESIDKVCVVWGV